jgi:hypothetical protein
MMGRSGHTPQIKLVHATAGLRPTALSVLMGILILTAVAATAGPSADVVPPELLEKARARGSVRVIVEVKLTEAADEAPEQVKRALLAELAGTRHRLIRALPGLSAIAIEASPEALRALAASPRVDRVTEDRLRPPLQ